MKLSRREWLAATATATAGLALGHRTQATISKAKTNSLKIGMCDWTMKKRNSTEALTLARQIGLDGAEIDLGPAETNLRLRQPEVQKEFLDTAKKLDLEIPSVGLLELNTVPLMSEPRAALWVADAIPTAKALGAKSILVPFFAKGELKEDNKDDMRRVTDVLAELAPRAEKAGIVLGLESYLSAEAHLQILDKVKSPNLKVYYDVFNAAHAKHDPIKEIRMLGRDRICQIHYKDWPYLEKGGGTVDWPTATDTLKEIGYDGWIVLEIGSSSGDFVADAKKNMAYVRRLFAK